MTAYSQFIVRVFTLLGAVLLLSACGSEDFSVRIARDPARVAEAFDEIRLDSALSTPFPGRKLTRTTPSENEILYTIGGNAGDPATIRFRFEPVESSKATVVHVAVDVPEMTVKIGGEQKELSEEKVELALRFIVSQLGNKLDSGESPSAARIKLSRLITVLSILSDRAATDKAMAMLDDPTLMIEQFAAQGGGPDGDGARLPLPSDPELELREQERMARRQQREAAMPMDSAKGVQPSGVAAKGADEQSGGWGSNR